METNKNYNEDCLKTMERMPDDFIDITVTSPPYDNLRNYKKYNFDFIKVAAELFRVTKPGGVVVWVVGDATVDGSETCSSFWQAIFFHQLGFKLHDTMIWEKHGVPQNSNRYENAFEYMFVLSKGKPKTFNPIKVKKLYKDKRKTKTMQRNKDGEHSYGGSSRVVDKIDYNIWKIPVGGGLVTKDKMAYDHPAIFPERLVYRHLISWSNEEDLVYDPFHGSGTTGKVAVATKRNWIGSEVSEEYCKIIKERLATVENSLL